MSQKIKVIVTGASGLIGSEICNLLLKNEFEVYGLYNKNGKSLTKFQKNKDFQAVRQDITNMASLDTLVKKIMPQAIFHAAACLPGPAISPQTFISSNVLGTLNLLEACRLNKVETFIHSSSMSVYGTNPAYLPIDEKHPADPYDFYSLSKKNAEDLCELYARNHKLNVIILRYSGVFGSGRTSGAVGQFVINALKNKPLSINNNISWDIIDVEDIAKANFLAYKKAAKLKYALINIGRGADINIIDLAKKIISFSKSKSSLNIASQFKKKPYRFYFDIKKAAKMLHFKPCGLDKGLKKYIDTLKA